MEETKVLTLEDLKKITGGTGNDSFPGMNCVSCGTFIPISMEQIMFAKYFVCPRCGMKYSIDTTRSVKAEEMLRKVQEAQDNLNKK